MQKPSIHTSATMPIRQAANTGCQKPGKSPVSCMLALIVKDTFGILSVNMSTPCVYPRVAFDDIVSDRSGMITVYDHSALSQ